MATGGSGLRLTLTLIVLAPLSLVLALASGSVPTSMDQLWSVLQGRADTLVYTLVIDIRLPRALSAFAVGGALALAGSLLQVLLRNPLADPYILGVSGGAAVGALGSILLGLGGAWLGGSAFFGALLSTAIVFGVSRAGGPWTPTRLLLTGVVMAAGWGALVSLILVLSPSPRLQGMLFWLMGDLSGNVRSALPGAALLIVLIACLPLARHLNLLARGGATAAALGVQVERVRPILYILSAALTGTAVAPAGGIVFVGLIVPHAARLLGGSDHRRLLPNAVLLGGSFLVLADTLARTALAPQQLPVGVVTALLGVPVFLFLLQRTYRVRR